jgi:hypothetical protein
MTELDEIFFGEGHDRKRVSSKMDLLGNENS